MTNIYSVKGVLNIYPGNWLNRAMKILQNHPEITNIIICETLKYRFDFSRTFSILEPLVSISNIWLLVRNKLCFLKSIFVIQVVLGANLLHSGQVCIQWRYLRRFLGDLNFELFFHFHKVIWMCFYVLLWPLLGCF